MQALLNRLKEPSTWAGLGVLLSLFGVKVLPEQLTAIVGVVTAICAALAVFLPEKKSTT